MKPTLAVDFDDVVASFKAAFSLYHNRVYGTDVEYMRIFSHDMYLVFDCDKADMSKRLDEFYESPEHGGIQPVENVGTVLKQLAAYYDIHIVTNRPVSRRTETLDWISRWCPNIVSDVHFTDFYAGSAQETKRPKSVVCKDIGANVLIEDAFRHASEVSEAGIRVLLPHRPWNRGQMAPNIIRVTSWNQIATLLLR